MDSNEIICSCFNLTVGDVKGAIKNGASTLKEVQEATQAGTLCGACMDDLEQLVKTVSAEAV